VASALRAATAVANETDTCDAFAAAGFVLVAVGTALYSVRISLIVQGALLLAAGALPAFRSTARVSKRPSNGE
jgi:hypothetical protein